MTAPPRADPVPAPVAGSGSSRSRGLAVLVTGLVVADLVRGLLLETYHVPSPASGPTIQPGDRVLVLKTDRRVEAGDLALVERPDGSLRLAGATGIATGSGADGQVVGTVVLRVWPPSRAGRVAEAAAS